MKNNIYIYPRFCKLDTGLFRLGGPGLGNLLFPWARFVVLAKKYGFKPITPTWPQIKIGPILRGESDYKFYLGLFRPLPGEIIGLKKLSLLMKLPRVNENSIEFRRGSSARPFIVEVEGMKNFFKPFSGSQSLIKSSLIEMIKPKIKPKIINRENYIAVHVRLGEFSVASNIKEIESGKNNIQLPIIWYRRVVESIRLGSKINIPVRIFTDGTLGEVKPLLSIPNTTLQKRTTSVGDLLVMSGACAFVASASTFSMWAAFLGQIPTVWFKGQKKQELVEKQGFEIETDLKGDVPIMFAKKCVFGFRNEKNNN